MTLDVAHYFFGELERVNTTRIVPSGEAEVKRHLDSWVPQMIQTAQEAEPDGDACRRLCNAWQSEAPPSELGLISLPVGDSPGFPGPYEHLVCRVWFNWATGGRVSRSGHAVLLSEAAWQRLDFNPFRVPVAAEGGASNFLDLRQLRLQPGDLHDLPAGGARLEELPGKIGHGWRNAMIDGAPLLLPADSPQELFECLLLLLPPQRRRGLRCWSGRFGVRQQYRAAFHLGRADDSQRPSAAAAPLAASPLGEALAELLAGRRQTEESAPEWPASPTRQLWDPQAMPGPVPPPASQPMPAPPPQVPPESPSPAIPPTGPFDILEPAPAPAPMSSHRPRRTWRWIAALLVLGLTYLGISSFFDERPGGSVDSWLEDVERDRLERPEELMKRGVELLRDAPDGTYGEIRGGMGKSLNSFRSLIAKKQSSSEPDEVAGAVADVERVEAMLRESALDVTWAASVKERLRKRAAALIRKPREVDERRRMLDKVLGAFARRDVDPGAEIERLRDDTLDLEASDAFAELAERWHDAKAAPGEIRMQDLDRQITDFRRRHADRLAEDAKKLKDEVVSACERHAWDGIVDDYRAFRDSLEEADYRQLEDSLNRYETRFSPFRFDHRVVDVTDFQRRLEEAPCVKVTAWAMVSGLQAEVRNDSRECRSGRFRLFDRKKIIRVEWRRRDEEGKLGKWLEGEMELGSLLTGNVKLADGEVEVTWVRAWPDLPTAR